MKSYASPVLPERPRRPGHRRAAFWAGLLLAGLFALPSAPAPAQAPPAPAAATTPEPRVPVLRPREITSARTQRGGLPAIPFLKIALGDLDGDHRPELLAGGKDGTLTLFRMSPEGRWEELPGWMEGVRVSAFSAPALGDLDGDGRLDLLVGTGGFSSLSGRVLVFRNLPGEGKPRWEPAGELPVDVGDDAAPALADLDLDGHLEILVGNSEGALRVFRRKHDFQYVQTSVPAGLAGSKGKYLAPGGSSPEGPGLVAIGVSTGRVRLFAVRRVAARVRLEPMLPALPAGSFPSPGFGDLDGDGRDELLVGDSDGNLAVWRADDAQYRRWVAEKRLVRPGIRFRPFCAPAAFPWESEGALALGDQDGRLSLLRKESPDGGWAEQEPSAGLPRANGFGRPAAGEWNGRHVLLTGEGSGIVSAYQDTGQPGRPAWVRIGGYPAGARVGGHAAPAALDLDGDGDPELVVGEQAGSLTVFRRREGSARSAPAVPDTERTPLEGIRAKGGFASPAFVEFRGFVWLFLGQQNGWIRVFTARRENGRVGPFTERDAAFPRFREHSAPTAFLEQEHLHVLVGDRYGNLREFEIELEEPPAPAPAAEVGAPVPPPSSAG